MGAHSTHWFLDASVAQVSPCPEPLPSVLPAESLPQLQASLPLPSLPFDHVCLTELWPCSGLSGVDEYPHLPLCELVGISAHMVAVWV